MPRVVMLGTGTEVGKTFVSAALLRALGARGLTVQGLKPIETGLGSEGVPAAEPIQGSDAYRLESTAAETGRGTPPPRPHPLYRYAEPLSPHLTAERADAPVRLDAVVKWTHNALDGIALHEIWQIVETAGGACSPLSLVETNLHLARALGPALLVLVAPDSLGVLHDLRATLSALEAAQMRPDAVALSNARAPDASTGTNASEIPRLGMPAPVAVFARDRSGDAAGLAAALIQRAAARGLG